jgi:hypothetical protein
MPKIRDTPRPKQTVFIAWSGPQSRSIAQAFRDSLPLMINAVKPWMSEADIDKGSQWHSELHSHLQDTAAGDSSALISTD